DDEGAAQDGAMQRADAADDYDGDELDRLDQRELFGRDEADLVRVKRAADAGQRRRDRERHGLVVGEIDAYAARRDFRIADRHERPSGRRAQEVDQREAGQHGEREAEIVEAFLTAQAITEQLDRLERFAAVAAGHRLPA